MTFKDKSTVPRYVRTIDHLFVVDVVRRMFQLSKATVFFRCIICKESEGSLLFLHVMHMEKNRSVAVMLSTLQRRRSLFLTKPGMSITYFKVILFYIES